MKTYVINLKSRPDRLEELKTANIPFEYEIFEATTKNEFPEIENNRMRGHAACQNSHMRLLSKIYQGSDEYTLVLEDDVQFTDKELAWTIIDTIIAADLLSDNKFDLLYLGGDVREKVVLPKELPVDRVNKVLQTHAYIIRKNFIPTLLEELEKGYEKVDVVFSRVLPKGNCFILKEPIAFQRDSKSDIDTKS